MPVSMSRVRKAAATLMLAPFLLKDRVLGEIDLRSGSISGAIHLLGAFVPEMLAPIAT